MKASQRRFSVIVADDHPIVCDGLTRLLSAHPSFRVIASYFNGADALEGLREQKPDLAVLDMYMPRLTGLEVLRAAASEGLPTRVLFLTANASDEQIVQSVTHGVWGIMTKDAAADELVNSLQKIAKGERCLSPELVLSAAAREAERIKDTELLNGALTARQQEIAALVAKGYSNKEIARVMSISEGTVKIHLHNAYQKLGVANRTSLIGRTQRGR